MYRVLCGERTTPGRSPCGESGNISRRSSVGRRSRKYFETSSVSHTCAIAGMGVVTILNDAYIFEEVKYMTFLSGFVQKCRHPSKGPVPGA